MSKPEYLKYRCCLCSNLDNPSTECPPKPFNPEITPCRFVKTYVDNRGWKYKVMSGIDQDTYKGRYQRPGKSGWKCMNNMEWRKTFDKAQSDLNTMAEAKGWKEAK